MSKQADKAPEALKVPTEPVEPEMRIAWMKIDSACVTPPNAAITRGNMPSLPVSGPVPSADVFLGGEWSIDVDDESGWVHVTAINGPLFGRMVSFPRERVREIMYEEVSSDAG